MAQYSLFEFKVNLFKSTQIPLIEITISFVSSIHWSFDDIGISRQVLPCSNARSILLYHQVKVIKIQDHHRLLLGLY
jgi:hypothetical protein